MFVYGATGAGKTFTMLGTEEMPGIIYLTMKSLFQKIEEVQDKRFDIGISYLEVRVAVIISVQYCQERGISKDSILVYVGLQ